MAPFHYIHNFDLADAARLAASCWALNCAPFDLAFSSGFKSFTFVDFFST